MQQGLGFIHVHAYSILSMPELVWKFNAFKLRWFPLFGVFTRLNVWTDEGQACDYSASCSVLPAFRMCTHHYATCVGIPIFRHQLSYWRLIQKSPVCWDYVPSGNGLRTGKKMSLALSQRCRKFTAVARTPSIARRVSRVVG